LLQASMPAMLFLLASTGPLNLMIRSLVGPSGS
jgi:hypothetical protein